MPLTITNTSFVFVLLIALLRSQSSQGGTVAKKQIMLNLSLFLVVSGLSNG
jgi:hypothetical protein